MQQEEQIQQILGELIQIRGQVNRLVSDAESEKEVRRDRNKEIDRRILAIEMWQAKWAGALIAITVIASILSISAILITIFSINKAP